jgi:cell division protein FtsQ
LCLLFWFSTRGVTDLITRQNHRPRSKLAYVVTLSLRGCFQTKYVLAKAAICTVALSTKPDIVGRSADVFGNLTVFMARRTTSTLPEEDFESVPEPRASSRTYDDESPLDARILALDEEEESPFLRGQKRVPVRRGALPRKTADRVKLLLILLLVLGAIGLIVVTLYRYGTQSWRFRIDSSDNLEVHGNHNVSRAQVLDAIGGDIERNIFFVSVTDQKKQVEAIPWIESASVMRLLPNRLRIDIHERTPVAFVEVNGRIAVIDAHGVIMDMPSGAQSMFSFPVIVGMSDNEPLSTRSARMKVYAELVKQLDTTGANYSHDLSEVDVSNPDDVRVTIADPKGAVLVHLRSPNFLGPFQLYIAHVEEWRTQFPRLDSVDLRFEGQVIVNPDSSAQNAKVPVAAPATSVSGAATAEAATPHKKPAKKAKKH